MLRCGHEFRVISHTRWKLTIGTIATSSQRNARSRSSATCLETLSSLRHTSPLPGWAPFRLPINFGTNLQSKLIVPCSWIYMATHQVLLRNIAEHGCSLDHAGLTLKVNIRWSYRDRARSLTAYGTQQSLQKFRERDRIHELPINQIQWICYQNPLPLDLKKDSIAQTLDFQDVNFSSCDAQCYQFPSRAIDWRHLRRTFSGLAMLNRCLEPLPTYVHFNLVRIWSQTFSTSFILPFLSTTVASLPLLLIDLFSFSIRSSLWLWRSGAPPVIFLEISNR
jgi:hypothetical protein